VGKITNPVRSTEPHAHYANEVPPDKKS
jgi:hypothetical protein